MTGQWIDKHKPGLEGIVGQKKAVDEVAALLASHKKGKGILLHGPTGCGKTLLVEAIARERGLSLMQLDASDKRNAESIDGFAQATRTRALFSTGKIILLDEVDGISGRDRGASASIIKLIKESSFPVFLVANDPWSQKLRSLRPYVHMVKLHKVPSPSIAKRLKEICRAEGIEPDDDAMKNLARWAQGDIRSAINDLQLVAQGKSAVGNEDLEILGFRERDFSVFEILPGIFKSGSIAAARKNIYSADNDSDEIFWWLESNIHIEFKDPEQRAFAYETLARADIFRSLVINQQNWRFKGYMVDIMAGVTLAKNLGQPGHSHGWTPYQPPKRFIDLARSRKGRALRDSAFKKLGSLTHSGRSKLAMDTIPYLRMIMKKDRKFASALGLDGDESKAIKQT